MAISAEPLRDLTPSEITALIESTDWERTPVGARSTWPQSLQTSLSITVNSAFPILLMWGPDLTVYYNSGYASMLGAKHPWAMGRPMREVWSEIWDIVGPMLDGVLQTGKATYSEDLLLPLFRNGYLEECYFTFSYSPIPEGNVVAGVFCAVAETTSKVIGERRLRTLHELESKALEARDVDAASLIAVDVLRRNVRDVPFSRIYLFDKNDRLRLVDGSGPAPRDDEDWPVDEVARSGEARVVSSTIGATATVGSAQPVAQAIVLPIAAAGETKATGAIVLGISPFRALDDEYRRFLELVAGQIATAINSARAYAEAKSRAEALATLDRAKTAFFSNISHEFRTPLTLLLGPIENVLRDAGEGLDSATRGELLTSRRNAYRLLKLVNHLLEFSRLEANRADASYESTDIAAFAADVASGFRSATDHAGLKLEVHAETPVTAYVDRGMFERILMNLISNAVKYTFRGRIEVSAWNDDANAFVRVADTGCGVPSEELPRLFERFHRVRGTEGRTHEGTGIGLALVDELVRLHGGKIEVESRVGQGSSFTVVIPRGTAHLRSERIIVSTAPARANAVRLTQYLEEISGWMGSPEPDMEIVTGGDRILVVDDNADLRSYLRRVLSKHWVVDVAEDGLKALERIRERAPNLVLSDIMMPNCDGIELLRVLRSNPQTERLPIILLSARAGEEASIDGLRRGADDYIVKPFSEDRLLAKIEAALKIAKLREGREQFLRTLADAIPQMILTALPDGTIEYFNQRWYEYTGMDPDQSVGTRGMETVHPDDAQRSLDAWKRALDTGEEFSIELRIRDREGAYRWFLCRAVAVRDPSGEIVRWLSSATDIDDQKRLAERQRLLQHAGEVLSSTLDVTEILDKITQLCVPEFADWCQIQVLSADDRLLIEAVHHRDPERGAALKRLVGRQVILSEASFGSPDVLRTATTRQLDHEHTVRAVRENVPNRADRRAYDEAGLGTALIVPLVARGESLGTLHLVNVDQNVSHSAEIVAIAEELARRAALAIDNSRLYQREHRVATALQKAMLPASLPQDARVEFNFAYRPAERESQVGGDWYDAFSIAPDLIAVSIGDVGGHGLGAAVAMSEARQALRLGAIEGLSPSELLRRVNSTLSLNENQPIITAIFGVIDLARSTFTYSCAGHPQPALAMLGNGARYLPGGGIPIGVMRDVNFPTHEVQLEPYSTLLLYTDGLIEFSRDIETESNRLLEGLHQRVQDLLADGADALLRYMLTRRQVDDIAILIVTTIPENAQPIDITLHAIRGSSAIARRIADRFGRVAKLSEERAFNLALAVGEGVANSAEHAYAGQAGDISLKISSRDGVVAGSIGDTGRWRQGPPMQDRGRGLEIVHAVTKRAQIERCATGTRLSFEV